MLLSWRVEGFIKAWDSGLARATSTALPWPAGARQSDGKVRGAPMGQGTKNHNGGGPFCCLMLLLSAGVAVAAALADAAGHEGMDRPGA